MARGRKKAELPKPLRRDDPWDDPKIREQIATRASMSRMDAENFDAYKNELTGIGDWLRDKTLGGRQGGLNFEVRFISAPAAEDRWRGSDLGAKVVEAVPDEMTREGWEISIQPSDEDEDEDEEGKQKDAFDFFGNENSSGGNGAPPMVSAGPPTGPLPEVDDEGAEIAEALDGKLEELGADEVIHMALCYERAYGGGAILLGADDGQEDFSKPLDEKRIKSIRWLNVVQGGAEGELVAWSYYRNPMEPKYGMPETYMLRNLGVPIAQLPVPGENINARQLMPDMNANMGYGPLIFWVHESRLLLFPGTAVSHRARVQMRGWGDSLFTRIDDVLSQYGQTWGGIANLMTDFSIGVLSIDGLAAKFSGGDKKSAGNPLTTRALQLQMARSIARMLLIDTKEKYQRETASLAGIADILQQFSLRLAAAADMPVTLLMGQAPAGLNATGASDVRFFYDRIAAKQKKKLLSPLKRLIKLLMLSKEGPTNGVEPERWNVEFRPLYQMTALETAQLRKTVAETDHIYVMDQVLSPEEVTASAFGGSEWSMERTIDFEGRQQMVEQAAEKAAAQEKIMSEAAKVGLQPNQLAPDHPEHPSQQEPVKEAPNAD